MELGTKFGLAASAGLAVVACGLFVAWQTTRREQAELQQKLNAAEQLVRDANARQESRKTELDDEMARLAAQRKTVRAPNQVIQALPTVLPLPKAIRIETRDPLAGATPQVTAGQPAQPDKSEPLEPKVHMPIEDLKPLYDFALSCKACQAELAAAQGDLKDEKAKTAALSRERDNALQAARGGSVAKRVLRAAKWFAIGAAAGFVAAKYSH